MKTPFRYDPIIFFVSILLLLAFTLFEVSQSNLIVFTIAIVCFGIPHGALDHLIAFNGKKRSTKNNLRFYTKYLVLVVFVFCCWYFAPLLSFFLFLLISAHHFGQSQLFYIKLPKRLLKHSFYLAWGTFVLSLIIWLNFSECLIIFHSLEWLNVSQWMSLSIWRWSVIISGFLLLTMFLHSITNHHITPQRVIYEFALLIIIACFSYFTNAVITFSVYFGLWHSLRSLILEYDSLKAGWARYNFRLLINDLLPFTLLAIVFLAFSFYFFTNFEMALSPYMIFIILISTLTVPHLFVMNDLYESHTA